ncbi:MAG: glycosyltransferase family 2 protein [Deltaproteobacteria bacterium]|nr:glycosyltransferase family 2 protein [Deltaproteobacteria bacterium]
MKVSLIIPIYNEAEHLDRFLQAVDGLELPIEKELVIINDCSRDSSGEILKSFTFKSLVILHEQPVNMGKGAAIRKGIELATGDIIGVQDADFEYDMNDIPQLIKPMVEEKAEVVYGSRFRFNGQQVHRTFHYLVNRLLTMLSNLLSGLYLTDMETCYKFFKKEIVKNINLETDRFGFEPEITAKVARLKIRVMEFPILYFPRNYIEGKKITWKDGLAAVGHIINFNIFSDKRKFFKKDMPDQYIPRGANWL